MKNKSNPNENGKLQYKNHEVLLQSFQNIVNVLDDSTKETNFKDECWQVVVKKQSAFDKKVWRKVDNVAQQKRISDAFEFPPFLVAQINDLSSTS